MARCESSHFLFSVIQKASGKTYSWTLSIRRRGKGKEKFGMEYYENDWDMYWDIVEDIYSNLSEKEIEEELMDME